MGTIQKDSDNTKKTKAKNLDQLAIEAPSLDYTRYYISVMNLIHKQTRIHRLPKIDITPFKNKLLKYMIQF